MTISRLLASWGKLSLKLSCSFKKFYLFVCVYVSYMFIQICESCVVYNGGSVTSNLSGVTLYVGK